MLNRILLMFVIVLMCVAIGSAQEDWNITGAGARAEGFGGAFIGIADDATAISWNPSGLGQLERVELSAVGRWIGEKYEWENPLRPSANESKTQSHFTYNFASIAFPLHAGKTTIVPAVGFQKQLDGYVQTDSYEATGGANTISPGIGIKLHPMLYVGGAVNIWLGNFENAEKETDTTYGVNRDGSYTGLNFTAGLLVDFEGMKKPIPIKLGAVVRTPFDLDVEADYQFLEGTTIHEAGKFDNVVELPFMIGLGASGRIGDNFTLAVDFETRLYGDCKIFRSRNKGELRDTLLLSDSETNLNQIRVGAEYLIVTRAGVIPLRAGFRTVPTLRANVNLEGEYSDQVVGNGFTVGTGFISDAFALDVTYSRSTWEQEVALTGATATQSYVSQSVSASLIVYF